jgi:hypothetical protein
MPGVLAPSLSPFFLFIARAPFHSYLSKFSPSFSNSLQSILMSQKDPLASAGAGAAPPHTLGDGVGVDPAAAINSPHEIVTPPENLNLKFPAISSRAQTLQRIGAEQAETKHAGMELAVKDPQAEVVPTSTTGNPTPLQATSDGTPTAKKKKDSTRSSATVATPTIVTVTTSSSTGSKQVATPDEAAAGAAAPIKSNVARQETKSGAAKLPESTTKNKEQDSSTPAATVTAAESTIVASPLLTFAAEGASNTVGRIANTTSTARAAAASDDPAVASDQRHLLRQLLSSFNAFDKRITAMEERQDTRYINLGKQFSDAMEGTRGRLAAIEDTVASLLPSSEQADSSEHRGQNGKRQFSDTASTLHSSTSKSKRKALLQEEGVLSKSGAGGDKNHAMLLSQVEDAVAFYQRHYYFPPQPVDVIDLAISKALEGETTLDVFKENHPLRYRIIHQHAKRKMSNNRGNFLRDFATFIKANNYSILLKNIDGTDPNSVASRLQVNIFGRKDGNDEKGYRKFVPTSLMYICAKNATRLRKDKHELLTRGDIAAMIWATGSVVQTLLGIKSAKGAGKQPTAKEKYKKVSV